MDAFLGKITSHAMNYAIRTGIGITASFAIKQTSRLLKTVDDSVEFRELRELQERLNSKIQIITPALNMVEVISARGNTTLESALTLTKRLRRDMEALAMRISKAASAEELSRKQHTKAQSRSTHEAEIRLVVYDIKALLTKLDSAIPEIQLAITTSGATLTTSLPATVSSSRLMQASTCITWGDIKYSMAPGIPVQILPSFTVSLYMLFEGHSNRIYEEGGRMRGATMKEVMHKARVRLMRVPLDSMPSDLHDSSIVQSIEGGESAQIRGEGQQNEFSYRLEIIEDLDDNRVHTVEEGETPPGPYGDVALAGMRVFLPIHQVSRIFYATTGKILGVEGSSGTNSPILLLGRDPNAQPPRLVTHNNDAMDSWDKFEEEGHTTQEEDDDENDIAEQIRRESSILQPDTPAPEPASALRAPWSLPPNLDPEWLAIGIWNEEEDDDDSNSDDEANFEQETHDDSAYASHRPSSSGGGTNAKSPASDLHKNFSDLNLHPASSPPTSKPYKPIPEQTSPEMFFAPGVRSLSLLEMLIRLTSLQQFQQASHLSIPDEFINFFLQDSSDSGTGAEDARKMMRRKATSRLGFDPYNESPIKRHGEDYQYQKATVEDGGDWDYERAPTPDARGWSERQRSMTPQRGGTPQTQPWLSRDTPGSRRNSPFPGQMPSSPVSPYRPNQQRKTTRPVDRVQRENVVKGSPLGRGQGNFDSDLDSTLGYSPGSPNLVERKDDVLGDHS